MQLLEDNTEEKALLIYQGIEAGKLRYLFNTANDKTGNSVFISQIDSWMTGSAE